MVRRELVTVVSVVVAFGMFFYARSLRSSAPLDASEAVAEAPAPAPVEAAERPAPQPIAVRASQPAARAQPVAPTPQAPAVVAEAAPPAPTPKPIAKPTPAPVALPAPPAPKPVPAAPAAPAVQRGNPDDSPERTRSGRVLASTDVALPPAFGPLDARVLVLVFSDFQCPVCRRAVDATHQIAEEWPGEVRVEFWQHALKMHRNAEVAAAASLAAHLQGRFWEYHDLLFQNQRALDQTSLEAYAQQLGLDMDRFKKDFADPELRKRIAREGELATALGSRGTPAFAINGQTAVGWGSWNGFRGQVERELNKARAAAAQGTTGAALHRERAKANITDAAVMAKYEALVIGAKARQSAK